MPEPLIPFDLYEPFLKAVESGESETRALRLQKMVALLSKPRLATLQALMEILVLVASKRHLNKMGAENLAVVFAPTLFRPQGDDLSQSMKDTPLTTACVVLMIDFFDRIFPAATPKKAPSRSVSPGPELFVPKALPVPTLPPLPEHRKVANLVSASATMGKSNKRGSVTLDNAQLGSLLARKAVVAGPSFDDLQALLGKHVFAQYVVDSRWYPAVVESFSAQEGLFVVVFSDYGNRQYCRRDQITMSDPNVVQVQQPAQLSPQLPPRSLSPPPPQLHHQVSAPVIARPEVLPRPAPARSNTVMTKSQPSIAQVMPRPRPPIAPRQSDSQLAEHVVGGSSTNLPPQPISPRAVQRSQTVMPARKSDNPLSSSSPVLTRPAPAPRPSAPTNSGAFSPVSVPQPIARTPPTVSPPQPLPPLPGLPPPNALPLHVVLSPRIDHSLSAPASVIEYEENDDNDDEDYTRSMDMPALPPKPDKILSQMKEIAQLQQQQQPKEEEEEEIVVAIDPNSLVSSAPPPAYVEFDDE